MFLTTLNRNFSYIQSWYYGGFSGNMCTYVLSNTWELLVDSGIKKHFLAILFKRKAYVYNPRPLEVKGRGGSEVKDHQLTSLGRWLRGSKHFLLLREPGSVSNISMVAHKFVTPAPGLWPPQAPGICAVHKIHVRKKQQKNEKFSFWDKISLSSSGCLGT